MIKLALKPADRWLELLPGLRILVRPATTPLIMAAQAAARSAADPGAARFAVVRHLASAAILDWEGVGDAHGQALACSAEGIEALIGVWPVADAFERLFLWPAMQVAADLDAEGNGCSPSPAGSSAGAESIAPAVPAPAAA